MTIKTVALIGTGLLAAFVLGAYLFDDGQKFWKEPKKLEFDVIEVDVAKLKAVVNENHINTIFLHPSFDDHLIGTDEVHLQPTAWETTAGRWQWRTIDNDLFYRREGEKLENVVGASAYQFTPDQLRYLLDATNRFETLTLTPRNDQVNNILVTYTITAKGVDGGNATVEPRFNTLNPSPPAMLTQ